MILKKLPLFLGVPQILFIILFALFVDYDDTVAGSDDGSSGSDEFRKMYPMFQDVHVMILIGFGFLMTILKRYGYGSVGFNFMLAVFVMQWAILLRGFFDQVGFADKKISLSLNNILNGDYASAAILVSFGAVLGVLSPVQLVVMAFIEVVFYCLNEFLIIQLFQVSDIGRSLVVHAFGAYFGLAVSVLHWRKELQKNPNHGFTYDSEMFSMLGTLFLWLYWPSFNAASAAGTMMGQRAVVTTVLSMSAAAVTAFAVSPVLQKSGKYSMIHLQNGSLAGGVAVGSVANLRLGTVGAVGVGAFAGLIAVMGCKFIMPVLFRRLRLHDSCGVHTLHGVPGILSAFVSVILARYSKLDKFSQEELIAIYPASIASDFDFHHQAKMQLAGLAVTLSLAIVGGLITGALLKHKFFENVRGDELFDDNNFWVIEGSKEDAADGNAVEETPLKVLNSSSTSSRDDEEKKSISDDAFAQQEVIDSEKVPLTADSG